jgi:hypothetical protein
MENIMKVDSVEIITNPCYYSGLEWIPDFATEQYRIPITVRMTGTGDFTQCVEELKRLFDKNSVQCWVRDCTFDGVYQPRLDRRPFIGAGNVGKVLQMLGIPEQSTLKAVRASAARVCSMTFDQACQEYKTLSTKSVRNLCFAAAYVYTLLTYGLGFTVSDVSDRTETLSQIQFTNFLSGQKIDWALGSIIYQANQEPPITIHEYLAKTKRIDTASVKAPKENITRAATAIMNELYDLLPDFALSAETPEGSSFFKSI